MGRDLTEILEECLYVMQDVSFFVLEHIVMCSGKLYNARQRVSMLEIGFPSVNEFHLDLVHPSGVPTILFIFRWFLFPCVRPVRFGSPISKVQHESWHILPQRHRLHPVQGPRRQDRAREYRATQPQNSPSTFSRSARPRSLRAVISRPASSTGLCLGNS